MNSLTWSKAVPYITSLSWGGWGSPQMALSLFSAEQKTAGEHIASGKGLLITITICLAGQGALYSSKLIKD